MDRDCIAVCSPEQRLTLKILNSDYVNRFFGGWKEGFVLVSDVPRKQKSPLWLLTAESIKDKWLYVSIGMPAPPTGRSKGRTEVIILGSM